MTTRLQSMVGGTAWGQVVMTFNIENVHKISNFAHSNFNSNNARLARYVIGKFPTPTANVNVHLISPILAFQS
jgi:hypothetical protein